MQGVYGYKQLTSYYPTRVFSFFTLRVEILEQTDTRFKVKFLQSHADGRKPGTVASVKRKSVKIDKVVQTELFNRLPYKDND